MLRLCPICRQDREGWPGCWQNDPANLKSLLYICADCADKRKVRHVEIQALGNTVITRPQPAVKTTQHIVVPETITDRSVIFGVVLSVGEGKTMPDGKIKPIDAEKGDVVLYTPDAVRGEPKIDGVYLQIVDADKLLAVELPG